MAIKQLVVEIDSQQIYEWVNSRETVRNLHSNLVEECKEMMKWNWKVDLQLILREANQTVDCLANNGVCGRSRIVTRWRIPPENVIDVLHKDKSGLRWPRKTSCNM